VTGPDGRQHAVYRDRQAAERATAEQIAAVLSLIQGVRLQLRQYGWWDVYDASGALAGWLFRERRWTGEPLLYHGRTARGTVVPFRSADMEPVLAAIIGAESQ
jgi:hypothetical protein